MRVYLILSYSGDSGTLIESAFTDIRKRDARLQLLCEKHPPGEGFGGYEAHSILVNEHVKNFNQI